MKILFVENHAVFAQQVIREFLSSHAVIVVPSIAAGRDAIASQRFDVILCDYDLDDGKGEVLVREFRANYPDTPIIAVSSHEAGNTALVSAGASATCGKMEFHNIQTVIDELFSRL